MKYETDAWSFIPAKDFLVVKPGRVVRVVVIHTAETLENSNTAENLGKYFQHPDYPSSSHIGIDSNSIVQYVKDSNVAFAAPGCNNDGIQIELAGRGAQSPAEWLDTFSLSMLAIAADATAQYCLKYDLPAIHLTDEQLKSGRRGIVGHDQVSRVYKKSDHSDPGPNFPWSRFMCMVDSQVKARIKH